MPPLLAALVYNPKHMQRPPRPRYLGASPDPTSAAAFTRENLNFGLPVQPVTDSDLTLSLLATSLPATARRGIIFFRGAGFPNVGSCGSSAITTLRAESSSAAAARSGYWSRLCLRRRTVCVSISGPAEVATSKAAPQIRCGQRNTGRSENSDQCVTAKMTSARRALQAVAERSRLLRVRRVRCGQGLCRCCGDRGGIVCKPCAAGQTHAVAGASGSATVSMRPAGKWQSAAGASASCAKRARSASRAANQPRGLCAGLATRRASPK